MKATECPRLFDPWRGARGILLALSGGPDSMALLHLAARWRAPASGPPLFAATVDHGLRTSATVEAQLAAAAAERLQIPHKILVWKGKKPASGIQEKARAARYELLLAHARALDADVIMTAHHADDQAETILFRLLRGSGLTGLTGMRDEMTLEDGVTLARPLLSLRKQELVDICTAFDQPFANDPSNDDPRYARTGLRQLLAGLEAQGLGTPDWTRLGRRLARAEEALADAARAAAVRSGLTGRKGSVSLNFAALTNEPPELGLRVLILAMERAGAKLPLRLEKLESLMPDFLEAANDGRVHAGTLGGLKLRLDHKGVLTLGPEPPRKVHKE